MQSTVTAPEATPIGTSVERPSGIAVDWFVYATVMGGMVDPGDDKMIRICVFPDAVTKYDLFEQFAIPAITALLLTFTDEEDVNYMWSEIQITYDRDRRHAWFRMVLRNDFSEADMTLVMDGLESLLDQTGHGSTKRRI